MHLFLPFGLLFLCTIALALTAVKTSNRQLRLWLTGAFLLLYGLNLAQAGLWTWVLRDGLGPDSVPSQGLIAVRRFFSEYWIFFLIGSTPMLLLLWPRKRFSQPENVHE